jgi:hypothetical protein
MTIDGRSARQMCTLCVFLFLFEVSRRDQQLLLSLSVLDAVDVVSTLPSLLSLSALDVVDIRYLFHRVHFLKEHDPYLHVKTYTLILLSDAFISCFQMPPRAKCCSPGYDVGEYRDVEQVL